MWLLAEPRDYYRDRRGRSCGANIAVQQSLEELIYRASCTTNPKSCYKIIAIRKKINVEYLVILSKISLKILAS